MAESNSTVKAMKKDSKIKKFLNSKGIKTAVQIGTTILTLANTVFLIWACSSAAEAEVNADVIDEYNAMKAMEVGPATETGVTEG